MTSAICLIQRKRLRFGSEALTPCSVSGSFPPGWRSALRARRVAARAQAGAGARLLRPPSAFRKLPASNSLTPGGQAGARVGTFQPRACKRRVPTRKAKLAGPGRAGLLWDCPVAAPPAVPPSPQQPRNPPPHPARVPPCRSQHGGPWTASTASPGSVVPRFRAHSEGPTAHTLLCSPTLFRDVV